MHIRVQLNGISQTEDTQPLHQREDMSSTPEDIRVLHPSSALPRQPPPISSCHRWVTPPLTFNGKGCFQCHTNGITPVSTFVPRCMARFLLRTLWFSTQTAPQLICSTTGGHVGHCDSEEYRAMDIPALVLCCMHVPCLLGTHLRWESLGPGMGVCSTLVKLSVFQSCTNLHSRQRG